VAADDEVVGHIYKANATPFFPMVSMTVANLLVVKEEIDELRDLDEPPAQGARRMATGPKLI
jgi:hypothetical protein